MGPLWSVLMMAMKAWACSAVTRPKSGAGGRGSAGPRIAFNVRSGHPGAGEDPVQDAQHLAQDWGRAGAIAGHRLQRSSPDLGRDRVVLEVGAGLWRHVSGSELGKGWVRHQV